MLGDDARMLVAEDAPPDVLPSLLVLVDIAAVAAENPDRVVPAVTGDHVAGQQDRGVIGQIIARAQLSARRHRQSPQQHRCGDQAVLVDLVHLVVETLVEIRIDPNPPAAFEGHLPFSVLVTPAPLGRDELDHTVTVLDAMRQVLGPFLVGGLQSAVPGGAGREEKRRTIGVGQVVAAFRPDDDALCVVSSCYRWRRNRTSPRCRAGPYSRHPSSSSECPGALLIRAEAHSPVAAAVPEAVDPSSPDPLGEVKRTVNSFTSRVGSRTTCRSRTASRTCPYADPILARPSTQTRTTNKAPNTFSS